MGGLRRYEVITPSGPSVGFEAERNSALTMGVLHLLVVVAGPLLTWDSELIDNRMVVVWSVGQAVLALGSFASAWSLMQGRLEQYARQAELQSFVTALAFGALPWLPTDLSASDPARLVLMIAAMAVTAIAATNSAHITNRRPLFWRLIVIVTVSNALAFGLRGETGLALLIVVWSVAIAAVTKVGHRAVLELLDLRQASEDSARRDDLTGLLSRLAFFEALHEAAVLDLSRGEDGQQILALFDLNDFKAINDGFGHVVGDKVLQIIGARLPNHLPGNARISRVGGDEFAVVFAGGRTGAGPIVDRALEALTKPIRVDDRELFISASSGWTVIDPAVSSAELMAQADVAMYHSKRFKLSESTGFDSDLRDQLDRSIDLRHRFRSALMKSEITFHAQPLVRFGDRCPVDEFVRIADETGLAVDLDRHALRSAAELLDRWAPDEFLNTLVVKVNISPVHLRNEKLVASIIDVIPAKHWNRLGLEFVESQLIPAADHNRHQLEKLMAMGITLSIDDFGVGYSSLTYLRSLPVSELKIDRSFVTALDSDSINQGLMKAIVDMATTLGLPTVAEGVETEQEFEAAQRLGVSVCQGYLTARPGPIADAAQLLHELRQQSLDSVSPA